MPDDETHDEVEPEPVDEAVDEAHDEPEEPAQVVEKEPWRGRLSAAVLKPSKRQLVVAVLLGLVGFGAVTQVRSNDLDESYSGLREQDLIDLLNGLSGNTQRAESEIADLRDTIDDLQSESTRRQTAVREAQREADQLSILAGAVPVQGPGIRITITEETGRVELGSMIDVVQELRTAEAEAMQFNGQVRVVAQTSFREVEGGFEIDGQLVEPPYVIDVIGEPAVLSQAITFGLGPRRQIERDGAEVTIDELRSLDIESVRDPEQPEFAAPE